MKSIKLAVFCVAVLFVAVSIAAPGAMKKVGKPGSWELSYTIGMNGKFYAVDNNAAFMVIDPKTGVKKQLSVLKFAIPVQGQDTVLIYHFTILGDKIYMSGSGKHSLYCVNPADGSYTQIGKDWNMDNVGAFAGFNGKLYGVKSDAALYEINLQTGEQNKISGYDFLETIAMFVANGKLFNMSRSGQLTEVHPADGSWVKLGKYDNWADFKGAFSVNNKLYILVQEWVESQKKNMYALYEVSTEDGAGKKVTVFLPPEDGNALGTFTSVGNMIYAVDAFKNLLEISIQ